MGHENSVATLEEQIEHKSPTTGIKAAKVKKPWGKRIVKFLLRGSIFLIVLLLVAQTVWVYSGSNQWEFIGEKNGVKAYTLKTPGSDLIQAKGVFRVHSTLAGIVAVMQDPEISKDFGGLDSHTVERVDDHVQYNYFREDSPFPFSPRDFMVMTLVYQSPVTKEVLIQYDAAPDKVPVNRCCVRVTQMNNSWRLTPLGNGEVEIEYIMHMNEGGYAPHFLLNLEHREIMFYLNNLQSLFDREKYKNAKIGFIQEK
ncbi:MAG TPA: START domain-containing protein [Ktedonobacteraceae bacterium]|nr:START domain-containing protein [Ktedonobacteraceae bacterium]